MSDSEKITTILKHIKRVEDNCNILAKKILEIDFYFALNLIKRGRSHDLSKFDFFEFNYLGNFEENKLEEFKIALKIHHNHNPHHPEYYPKGIHQMSDLDIAEMVCDCVARGQEFGTDTREWFYKQATLKYGFTMQDSCGQKIEKYLNLLLTKPF